MGSCIWAGEDKETSNLFCTYYLEPCSYDQNCPMYEHYEEGQKRRTKKHYDALNLSSKAEKGE